MIFKLFVRKMWSKEQAQVVMRDLTQYVDVCIANDEDFEATLGIQAFDGDLSMGIDQIDTYKEGMLEITRQFPNVKSVTSVLRNMHTVEEGDWMGIYYVDGKFYQSPIHRVLIVFFESVQFRNKDECLNYEHGMKFREKNKNCFCYRKSEHRKLG